MHSLLIVAASFLACAVEMVEAVTIVLAVGVTRGWRSAAWGVGVALLALAVIVALLGPALAHLPIDAMRLVVGTLLLLFGLQWLRKAILRASGLKAMHDEEAIYEAEVALLRAAGGEPGHDWYAFTVAFKGVFLEGLEVAFIVVTFGGTQRNVGLAAIGAAAALVVVLIAAVIVHEPLTPRPGEHGEVRSRRDAHGVRHLLEQRGSRPRVARRRRRPGRRGGLRARHRAGPRRAHRPAPRAPEGDDGVKYIRQFLKFWYDFIVGDDWRLAIGVVVIVGIVVVLAQNGFNWWWLLPVAVACLLTMSVLQELRRHSPR